MLEAVKAWCIARVGEGYIYGAKGQMCGLAFRRQQAAQYPDQADKILGIGAKWDGVPVWDCAQLTRYAAKQGGVSLVSGATSQWKKTSWRMKGEIGTLPSEEIAFLYAASGSGMKHTGVYLGDGTFVHAKGTAYGVLHQRMDEYNWTNWAIPYWAQEEEKDMDVLYGVRVIGGKLNLRESPSTEAKRIGQLPDGELATVYMEENGWLYVKATVNGERLCGWCKEEFTERYKPADDEEEPETVKPDEAETIGQVTIRLEWNIGKALYNALKSVYGDDAK